MASQKKKKDTVPKGVAYSIIGVLVLLCVGVFGFIGWGAIQYLGLTPTAGGSRNTVELTMDNIWDYFVFTANFSDLRNERSERLFTLTTYYADATFTLDISPRSNVEFNNVTIEIRGHVGLWEWSFGEWDSGNLEHTELHRFIEIPFDGRTSITATIYGMSNVLSGEVLGQGLSLPSGHGPPPVAVSGTVTYR